ncbi:MAG: RIP metalloprotease RseP [Campylobacterota bacterium]|nr:RIP metalloprotease RseP [Campylobacterota bacterium]
MGFIAFLLVLTVLVFVHEFGHFIVARAFGVKVNTFSIGMGKKLISKEYKGTVWTLSLLPIGGYVQMKGQEDLDPKASSSDPDSYNVKTPFQKILILLAGPFFNFLLAFFIYIGIGMMGTNYLSPTIGSVVENSPAQKIGLLANDKILKIDNQDIKTWDDLSDIIKNSKGVLYFEIERDNKIKTFILNPEMSDTQNMFKEKIRKRMIGISPAPIIVTIDYNFFESIAFAYDRVYEASKMIYLGIVKMIEGVIPATEIGGVISIEKVISEASQTSIIALLSIAALLSVNLGVLNLLPIPALDGGHIMFNSYELITGRKTNTKVLITLTIAGWAILALLMGFGIYNDINRIIEN